MSATRDKNQKVTFVYSNLYQIYKKGTEAAKNADVSAASESSPVVINNGAVNPGLTVDTRGLSSGVVKAEDLRAKVSEYQPVEFVGKRVAARLNAEALSIVSSPSVAPAIAPAVRPSHVAEKRVAPAEALRGLQDNLKTLNELHSRLKFMLQELEDLVTKS